VLAHRPPAFRGACSTSGAEIAKARRERVRPVRLFSFVEHDVAERFGGIGLLRE